MHANYLLLGLVAGVAAAPLPAPDVAADTPSQGDNVDGGTSWVQKRSDYDFPIVYPSTLFDDNKYKESSSSSDPSGGYYKRPEETPEQIAEGFNRYNSLNKKALEALMRGVERGPERDARIAEMDREKKDLTGDEKIDWMSEDQRNAAKAQKPRRKITFWKRSGDKKYKASSSSSDPVRGYYEPPEETKEQIAKRSNRPNSSRRKVIEALMGDNESGPERDAKIAEMDRERKDLTGDEKIDWMSEDQRNAAKAQKPRRKITFWKRSGDYYDHPDPSAT
ncbi:hypothetical protein MCOR07_008932 [Pyricularia oryzae]|nr:hypothetical protein MCOR21_006170 [Pyricularia oryzae]KAI6439011.1 hypothetical protein MCOR22_008327 [Pyricularia oryzae]KAI6613879.1 hypothetical protein MCOR07_008932 [Pyricularia oryzae]